MSLNLRYLVAESRCSPHMSVMWTYSKNPVLQGATDQIKPTRTRESVLASAAELKLKREQDASQAMKEYHAEKAATLAKTARLRAARLARDAEEATLVKKPKRSK